jgi:YihY family inner membrane protein
MSMFSKSARRKTGAGSLSLAPEPVAPGTRSPSIAYPPQQEAEARAQSGGGPLDAENASLEQVHPTVAVVGWWPQTRQLLGFLSQTEVHTYAFSVAANVIFSLFPFIVLIITVSQRIFHSRATSDAIRDMLDSLLPTGGAYVYHKMAGLVHPHKGVQLFSIFMLLITSTGVFLPLEVALNEVWGVKKHRNYLQNQIISLLLAASVGVLVLGSVAITAGQHSVMEWIFFGHTDNIVFRVLARGVLEFFATIAGILMFFLIYWILPHRRIPAMAVLPTSIVVGLAWAVAKYIYVLLLPRLDFEAVYGPFANVVGLMMWAFLSGLMLLAGAHFSATRFALQVARQAKDKATDKT